MRIQKQTPERPVDEKALADVLNGDPELTTSKSPDDAMKWLRDVYGISVKSLMDRFGIKGNPDVTDADLLINDGDGKSGMIRINIPGTDLTGRAVKFPLVKYEVVGETRYQWSVPSGGSEILFAGPEEDDLVCLRLADIQQSQARVIRNTARGGHAAA